MNIKIPIGNYELIIKRTFGTSRKNYCSWYTKSAIMLRKKNRQEVVGYTNRCEDGKFVLFLDYDSIEYSWLETELEHLITRYNLGDTFIFESSPGSYHVVCFDKMSKEQFVRIAEETSVDEAYVYVPQRYGKGVWTLRLTDKGNFPIKFVKMLKGKGTREQSRAHIELIERLFNLKISKGKCDKLKKLVLCKYPI